MAKKVTLDTLEIKELEIPLPEITPPVEEADEQSSGKLPVARLLIFALALVMLIAAGGASFWWIGAHKTTPPLVRKDVPAAAPLRKGPLTAQVNDFIITLTDDKGNYVVMTCDLALELSAGQDAVLRQNIIEVRQLIYEILKNKKVVSLLDPRSRNGLKEEINKAVSGVLKQDAIKAIYFTKFVVI